MEQVDAGWRDYARGKCLTVIERRGPAPTVLTELELTIHATGIGLDLITDDSRGAHLRGMIVDTHRTHGRSIWPCPGTPPPQCPAPAAFASVTMKWCCNFMNPLSGMSATLLQRSTPVDPAYTPFAIADSEERLTSCCTAGDEVGASVPDETGGGSGRDGCTGASPFAGFASDCFDELRPAGVVRAPT